MTDFDIHAAMAILAEQMPRYQQPLIDAMGEEGQSPFHILIATILSLRTKDTLTAVVVRRLFAAVAEQAAADAATSAAAEGETAAEGWVSEKNLRLRTKDTLTAVVAPRLFAVADTPAAMLALDEARIAELIYPVGFYRTKARSIRQICARLIEQHDGQVPNDLDALLALPGVGRKTANLVLTMGFGLPGICVDTHVHRICNIWGYVHTKNPDATELALRAKLPPEYWLPINGLLATLGQNICHPVSPRCSVCPIASYCPRIGVVRSR